MHISIFIACSLDGFIARSDGQIDFLDMCAARGEDFGFKAFYSSIDTLVMGRKTYDTVAAFDKWPYEGKRVIVLSHSINKARAGVEVSCEDPSQLAWRLEREGVKHIWVDGGITASAFLRAGLVDQLIVSYIPVLLGEGRPLFSNVGIERRLKLESCKSYDMGLVQVVYSLV